MKYYFLAFKNIFNFKGEATLKEFWSFFIINLIVSIIVAIIFNKLLVPNYVLTIYRVICVLALIAVGFRRLKNAGMSGWLFLIPLVNLIFASLPEKNLKEI